MLWLQCDASYNQTHDTWHTTVAGAGLTMELFNVKFREYHHRWHWLIAGLRTTGLDNVFYLTCISNNEDKSVTRTADIVSHTCVLSLMLNTYNIMRGLCQCLCAWSKHLYNQLWCGEEDFYTLKWLQQITDHQIGKTFLAPSGAQGVTISVHQSVCWSLKYSVLLFKV